MTAIHVCVALEHSSLQDQRARRRRRFGPSDRIERFAHRRVVGVSSQAHRFSIRLRCHLQRWRRCHLGRHRASLSSVHWSRARALRRRTPLSFERQWVTTVLAAVPSLFKLEYTLRYSSRHTNSHSLYSLALGTAFLSASMTLARIWRLWILPVAPRGSGPGAKNMCSMCGTLKCAKCCRANSKSSRLVVRASCAAA